MTYPKWVPRGDGQQILCHSEEEEAQASVSTKVYEDGTSVTGPAPLPDDPPAEVVASEPVKNRGGRPRKVQ